MNTKLYALLLTLVCAATTVQASEENKGPQSADNSSAHARSATRIPSRFCMSCPFCRSRTRGTQPNQNTPKPIQWDYLVAEAVVQSLFGDISSLEESSPTIQQSQASSPKGACE